MYIAITELMVGILRLQCITVVYFVSKGQLMYNL